MLYWRAKVIRWIDDDPGSGGWVEARAVDAEDREWVFVDKVPIFTIEPLTASTAYPVKGFIGCEVVSAGHETSVVRTLWSAGVLAEADPKDGSAGEGEYEFQVRSSDLVEPPGYA